MARRIFPAALLPGHNPPEKNDSRSIVMLANILSINGVIPAFVKIHKMTANDEEARGKTERLAKDLAGWLLCDAVGLPVPPAHLVICHPAQAPGLITEQTFAVGLEQVHGNPARLTNARTLMYEKIKGEQWFDLLCGFDEWTATFDRLQNVIYDGNAPHLIDHDDMLNCATKARHPNGNECLDRSAMEIGPLELDKRRVLNRIKPPKKADDLIAQAVDSLEHILSDIHRIDQGKAHAIAIRQILVERAAHLDGLLREALGLDKPIDYAELF